MKDNSTSAASPISQEALNSLLITAAENPLGEAQDENGLTQTVAELLARGADVNAATANGSTALILAAQNDHAEIVSALLSHDRINVNAVTTDGYTALMVAAQNGHTETVLAFIFSALLSDRINFNAVTSYGYTALMLAAIDGHAETVSALLSCGEIEVNAVTSYGSTALTLAAQNGHTETVSALLSRDGINVNAVASDGSTALMIAAYNGHAETVLALLSRDGVDWQIVQNQLRHPALRNLNEEVSLLLAVIIPDKKLPDKELRNSIIESFNQRNPNSPINQENNDILGAGPEMYKTLKDLKSWHKRYLTDSGVPQNEVEILANQRFFDLLNHQGAREEALARNSLVTDLFSKSESLAVDFVRKGSAQNFLKMIPEIIEDQEKALVAAEGDQDALNALTILGPEDLKKNAEKGIIPEDPGALEALKGLSPEDFYKLTTKIIDKSKAENDGVPKLQALSLVVALRKDRTDQASASPTPIMTRGSTVSIAEPILAPRKNGGFCVVS